MKKLYFTRHAKRRMKWRNLTVKEVEETLAFPDKTQKLPTGRINAFKLMGNKSIRVSFLEEAERIIVISVVDKNK